MSRRPAARLSEDQEPRLLAARGNGIPVDAQLILEKVMQLPVATWQYTAEEATVRHIGPMAQDFHAAFSVGANEVSIATIDADGVALAAIQGLHQLVQERDARIGLLESRLQAQQQALDELR